MAERNFKIFVHQKNAKKAKENQQGNAANLHFLRDIPFDIILKNKNKEIENQQGNPAQLHFLRDFPFGMFFDFIGVFEISLSAD